VADALEVHAWVELEGEPGDERKSETETYNRLDWDQAEEFRNRIRSTK